MQKLGEKKNISDFLSNLLPDTQIMDKSLRCFLKTQAAGPLPRVCD